MSYKNLKQACSRGIHRLEELAVRRPRATMVGLIVAPIIVNYLGRNWGKIAGGLEDIVYHISPMGHAAAQTDAQVATVALVDADENVKDFCVWEFYEDEQGGIPLGYNLDTDGDPSNKIVEFVPEESKDYIFTSNKEGEPLWNYVYYSGTDTNPNMPGDQPLESSKNYKLYMHFNLKHPLYTLMETQPPAPSKPAPQPSTSD